MAGINLTPHVPVILGQATLFALAYVAVKRLIMEPYMALRKRREAVTGDVVYDVSDIYAKIEQRKQQMQEDTERVLAAVQKEREAANIEAHTNAKALIVAAQKQADLQVQAQSQVVMDMLVQEKPASEALAETLADNIWKQVLLV